MSWHFHYRSEVFIAKCEEPVLISYFPLTMFSSPHTRYGCRVETGSCKGRWLCTSHRGRAFNGFHVDTCLIFTLVSCLILLSCNPHLVRGLESRRLHHQFEVVMARCQGWHCSLIVVSLINFCIFLYDHVPFLHVPAPLFCVLWLAK